MHWMTIFLSSTSQERTYTERFYTFRPITGKTSANTYISVFFNENRELRNFTFWSEKVKGYYNYPYSGSPGKAEMQKQLNEEETKRGDNGIWSKWLITRKNLLR